MTSLKSMLLEPFLTFLRDDKPTPAQALPQLRLVFVFGFVVQLGVAGLVGFMMRLLAGAPSGDATLMAQVLLGLSLLQGVPVALLASPTAHDGGKQAALSATIATAVLFAAPGWFVAFAWLVGVPALYLLALVAVLMVYYALGLLLVGRYAGWLEPSPHDNTTSS
ncbi:MAG: hypothetical protein U5L04_09855 [Trueperaceae bacterium]|nr:hypothetical protein [Trueperaceae bacterium]